MKHKKISQLSFVPACVLGVLGCLVISVLLIMLSSLLIYNEHLQLSTGKYLTITTHFLSALIGCFLAGKAAGEKYRTVETIVSAGYLLMLIIISLLFGEGVHGNLLLTVIAASLGCVSGILLCAQKRTPKRKKQIRRFR